MISIVYLQKKKDRKLLKTSRLIKKKCKNPNLKPPIESRPDGQPLLDNIWSITPQLDTNVESTQSHYQKRFQENFSGEISKN